VVADAYHTTDRRQTSSERQVLIVILIAQVLVTSSDARVLIVQVPITVSEAQVLNIVLEIVCKTVDRRQASCCSVANIRQTSDIA